METFIINDETLHKIKKFWSSEDAEDKKLAMSWLVSEIGEKNAKTNLYLAEFYKNDEHDDDLVFDENNYFKMVFQTSKRGRNGDYYYHVHFDVKLNGDQVIDYSQDYSRFNVGSGQPRFDLGIAVSERLRKAEYALYSILLNPLK